MWWTRARPEDGSRELELTVWETEPPTLIVTK